MFSQWRKVRLRQISLTATTEATLRVALKRQKPKLGTRRFSECQPTLERLGTGIETIERDCRTILIPYQDIANQPIVRQWCPTLYLFRPTRPSSRYSRRIVDGSYVLQTRLVVQPVSDNIKAPAVRRIEATSTDENAIGKYSIGTKAAEVYLVPYNLIAVLCLSLSSTVRYEVGVLDPTCDWK